MRRYLGFGLLLLACNIAPAWANLVTDPGFESCTQLFQSPPPGWSTTNGNFACGMNPHSGMWSADESNASSTLSQAIPTTPGVTYDFSFWFRGDPGSPSGFSASFGGNQVFDLTNPAPFGYTFEDFTVTATTASTTIAFTAFSNAGAWIVDDVSVTQVQAAPVLEPASWLLLATGLIGLLGFGSRRRAVAV